MRGERRRNERRGEGEKDRMKKEGGGEGEEVKIGKEEIGRRRWEG